MLAVRSIGRPYTSGGFSVADNGAYAYSAGGPERPADVAAGRRGGAASRLTSLNDDLLAHKTLGKVEEITWQSSVGDYNLQGWLVTPPGFRSRKEISTDSRDPRRSGRRLWSAFHLRYSVIRSRGVCRALHEPARLDELRG